MLKEKKDPKWLEEYKAQFEHPLELASETENYGLRAHALLTRWELRDLLKLLYDKKYDMACALENNPDVHYSITTLDSAEMALRSALADLGQQGCAYDDAWVNIMNKHNKKNRK